MENRYKRKKEPLENRNLILAAAIQIVIMNGLEALTIDAVARQAGLSKGGVLHHFPKKEALIDEVFNSRLAEFTKLFQEELKGKTVSSPVAYLRASFRYEPGEEHSRVLKVLYQAVLQYEQYRELLKDWYRLHVTSNINECTPTDVAAILMADGFLMSFLTGSYVVSPSQKRQVINLLKSIENEK